MGRTSGERYAEWDDLALALGPWEAHLRATDPGAYSDHRYYAENGLETGVRAHNRRRRERPHGTP